MEGQRKDECAGQLEDSSQKDRAVFEVSDSADEKVMAMGGSEKNELKVQSSSCVVRLVSSWDWGILSDSPHCGSPRECVALGTWSWGRTSQEVVPETDEGKLQENRIHELMAFLDARNLLEMFNDRVEMSERTSRPLERHFDSDILPRMSKGRCVYERGGHADWRRAWRSSKLEASYSTARRGPGRFERRSAGPHLFRWHPRYVHAQLQHVAQDIGLCAARSGAAELSWSSWSTGQIGCRCRRRAPTSGCRLGRVWCCDHVGVRADAYDHERGTRRIGDMEPIAGCEPTC